MVAVSFQEESVADAQSAAPAVLNDDGATDESEKTKQQIIDEHGVSASDVLLASTPHSSSLSVAPSKAHTPRADDEEEAELRLSEPRRAALESTKRVHMSDEVLSLHDALSSISDTRPPLGIRSHSLGQYIGADSRLNSNCNTGRTDFSTLEAPLGASVYDFDDNQSSYATIGQPKSALLCASSAPSSPVQRQAPSLLDSDADVESSSPTIKLKPLKRRSVSSVNLNNPIDDLPAVELAPLPTVTFNTGEKKAYPEKSKNTSTGSGASGSRPTSTVRKSRERTQSGHFESPSAEKEASSTTPKTPREKKKRNGKDSNKLIFSIIYIDYYIISLFTYIIHRCRIASSSQATQRHLIPSRVATSQRQFRRAYSRLARQT